MSINICHFNGQSVYFDNTLFEEQAKELLGNYSAIINEYGNIEEEKAKAEIDWEFG